MPEPDHAWLSWVREALGVLEVDVVRGMRDGGSPWLLRVRSCGDERDVVLRVGSENALRTESAGIALARSAGLPAPAVLARDGDRDRALLVVEAVTGSSAIPTTRPTRRLRTLGATAVALHATPVPDDAALPHRDRPIAGVDFAALRRASSPHPLPDRAEHVVTALHPSGGPGLVHGDLWQGSTLWRGDDLAAVIDWDCAGSGRAGVDLGSLRCDAAVCFGVDAAADVLDGWQAAAGRAADDVAYWDAVAALCTPPDMGWFVQAIGSQQRPDLTQQVLLERRDAFLQAALTALEHADEGVADRRPPRPATACWSSVCEDGMAAGQRGVDVGVAVGTWGPLL